MKFVFIILNNYDLRYVSFFYIIEEVLLNVESPLISAIINYILNYYYLSIYAL